MQNNNKGEQQLFDVFNIINSQNNNNFQQGYTQGKNEAQKHDTSQIQKQGYLYGIQFGKQIALYQGFIDIFNTDQKGKISQKIKKNLQSLNQLVKNMKLSNFQQIKQQRRIMAHKFKIILSMLKIKQNLIETPEKHKHTQNADF